MKRSCGVARKAYNEMLKTWGDEYKAGGKPTWVKIQKAFVKRVPSEFPYMLEVGCDAYYQPARHLNNAFSQFFKNTAKYPRFKKKGSSDSYKAAFVKHVGNVITLPKVGKIRCAQSPRFSGRIVSATVASVAGTWEVSLLYETDDKQNYPKAKNDLVGIDLGIKNAITLSTGETFEGPKPLKKYKKKLRRLSQSLSKKQKGSNRRLVAKTKLARLHRRIRNIRKDWCHKVTTKIANDTQVAVMEDLNTKGMLRNHCLARAISDIGFYQIRRLLTYKMEDRKRTLKFADRFYPSSKLCNHCGESHKELTLSDRVFSCPFCGHTEDRDLNAAKNLALVATTQAHWECKGRGEDKAVKVRKNLKAPSSKRQLKLKADIESAERQD